MRVDEKLFAKIQNYMLIGVSIILFFVVVNSVFSSGIIRAGDRDILFDSTQIDHKRSTYITITKEEETTVPPTTEQEIGFHGVSPIAVVSSNRSAASVRATTPRPTIAPTTQPQTLAPDTTAAPTDAPTTALVTEPTEVTTAPHTTVEPTTAAESTVPSSSVEPTESTAPSSSVDPSESVEVSAEPTESETKDPNAFSGIIEAIERLIGIDGNRTTDPSATSSTDISPTDKEQPGSSSLDTTLSTRDTRASSDITTKSQKAQSSDTAKISGGFSSVQTGSSSMAIIVLIVISSLTVAMFFACRKEH